MMVAKGVPCMGPVTQTGCGVLCPAHGRDCYACYGPAENANAASLAQRLRANGLGATGREAPLPVDQQRRAGLRRGRRERSPGS
ncbi:MAG: hypothetical protein MZW92_16230 [Comamonadaceae bacterium]|nr:hypothetical protein [Comamonadaceae bacterium]